MTELEKEIEHTAIELWERRVDSEARLSWHQIAERTRERYRTEAKAMLWCDLMEKDYLD